MPTLTPSDIQTFVQQQPITLLYFKGDNCTVCQALGPKLRALSEALAVPMLTINMPDNLHLAATEMVLSVPVVKLYVEGREVAKEGAYLQVPQLEARIQQWQAALR